jgi:hypothetical protein
VVEQGKTEPPLHRETKQVRGIKRADGEELRGIEGDLEGKRKA